MRRVQESRSQTLPGLPSEGAQTLFDAKSLPNHLPGLTEQHFRETNRLTGEPGFFARRRIRAVAENAEKYATRYAEISPNGMIDKRLAAVAIDHSEHETKNRSVQRRNLLYGGLLWTGGTVAGGLIGWGIGWGLAHGAGALAPHLNAWFHWHLNVKAIQDGASASLLPVLTGVIGAFTGAVGGFFNDSITNPVRVLPPKLAARKSPDRAQISASLSAETIVNWGLEQTVDGRVMGARYAFMQYMMQPTATFGEIKRAFRESPQDAKAAVEESADFLSGALSAFEVLWFYVRPESHDLWHHGRSILSPYLRKLTPEQKQMLSDEALKQIADKRPKNGDDKWPDFEKAKTTYYVPMLQELGLPAPTGTTPTMPTPDPAPHAN